MFNLKSSIIKSQDKIVLVIGFILVSLISFGAGRLSINQKVNPIVIEDSEIFKAEIGQLTDKIGERLLGEKEDNIEKGLFVGSKNSNKYHLPDCQWAKRIKKENQIWFNSVEEAKSKGYSPCGFCKPPG